MNLLGGNFASGFVFVEHSNKAPILLHSTRQTRKLNTTQYSTTSVTDLLSWGNTGVRDPYDEIRKLFRVLETRVQEFPPYSLTEEEELKLALLATTGLMKPAVQKEYIYHVFQSCLTNLASYHVFHFSHKLNE